MTHNRLHKSKAEHMVFGVCGGLAEYFSIDPVLVRLIFVLFTIAGGTGILAYIVLAIIMPSQDSVDSRPSDVVRENIQNMKQETIDAAQQIKETFASGAGSSQQGQAPSAPPPPQPASPPIPPVPPAHERHDRNRFGLAIILIVAGALLFAGNLGMFGWFNWDRYWPLLLILIGVLIIVLRSGRRL